MAVKRSRHRRVCLDSSGELGDLYDYARPTAPRCRRRHPGNEAPIIVTDDWPDAVPITEAELRVVEAHLSDILDAIFGPLP